ncbi:Craniofacial development protein 1 [Dispira simplex]|nr:Craniofacial development protein 1 [Dispira simplex]
MSTGSDSESDIDFVPDTHELTASDSDVTDSEQDDTTTRSIAENDEERELKRRRIDTLWEDIKGSTIAQSDTRKTVKAESVSTKPSIEMSQSVRPTTSNNDSSIAIDQVSVHPSAPPPTTKTVTTHAKPSVGRPSPRPTSRPARGPRRAPSRVSQLAASLKADTSRKPTVFELTRRNWSSFVKEEDIREELAHHNKDGYLERQAFLQRAEAREDAVYRQVRQKYKR